MDTKFFPSFNDSTLSALERCADQVNAQVPNELSEFETLRTTILARAEKVLAEGNTADLDAIIATVTTFKVIYLKAHEQKNAYESRLQERRNALKDLLEDF